MASGSSGSKSGNSSRRRGAQQRLTWKQMQANRGRTGGQTRRMRIARNNASIPF